MSFWKRFWNRGVEVGVIKTAVVTSNPYDTYMTLSPKEIRRLERILRGKKEPFKLIGRSGHIGTTIEAIIDGVTYNITDYDMW